MKKFMAIGFGLITIFLIAFLFFQKSNSVERYGTLLRSSTSGDVRFSYYDINEKKSLESWENRPWFFALASEDETDNYLNYIQEHQGSVFKITGKKEVDDCDYFGNGICLENISVEKIESVFERELNINETVVSCKNGDKYTGKDLIEKGMNFQTNGRMITYKGEELQKLCDPTVKEYDYDMEPNYGIVPSYQN
jgi:hypothetical protein